MLNLGAGAIELGIRSTLEARIGALETAINPFFCAGVLYPIRGHQSVEGPSWVYSVCVQQWGGLQHYLRAIIRIP